MAFVSFPCLLPICQAFRSNLGPTKLPSPDLNRYRSKNKTRAWGVIFAGETCIFFQVWTWQNKPAEKYVSLEPRLEPGFLAVFSRRFSGLNLGKNPGQPNLGKMSGLILTWIFAWPFSKHRLIPQLSFTAGSLTPQIFKTSIRLYCWIVFLF